MKYSLSATLLAVLLSSSSVVDAQPPACAFKLGTALPPGHASDPGNSGEKRQAEFNVPPGMANSAGLMRVCSEDFPGGAKEFHVVASTDFGPAGGQPLESWSGQADDGSELNFVVDEHGHSTASVTDLPGKTITSIGRDAQGNLMSEMRSVNDYPDEADPEDIGVDLTVGMDDLNRRALRSSGDAAAKAESFGTNDRSSRRLVEGGHQMDVLVLWTKNAECRNSNLARGCTTTATTEANIRSRIVSIVL